MTPQEAYDYAYDAYFKNEVGLDYTDKSVAFDKAFMKRISKKPNRDDLKKAFKEGRRMGIIDNVCEKIGI